MVLYIIDMGNIAIGIIPTEESQCIKVIPLIIDEKSWVMVLEAERNLCYIKMNFFVALASGRHGYSDYGCQTPKTPEVCLNALSH